MDLWEKIRAIGSRMISCIKKPIQKIQASIDSAIPSKNVQAVLWASFFFLEFLIAYAIALVHVGIWNDKTSVFELIEIYDKQGESFPFLLFLLFSALLVVVFVFIIRALSGEGGRSFRFSESDVYGSAREISMEDLSKVAEVKPIEALSGTILGQLDGTGKRVIGIHPDPIANKNLLVTGTPGVGKSFSIVKNQIVQAIRRGESVVCTDTKYELRADTLELARRYGYTIRFLDLKDLMYSDGWAVLKELRCDDVRAMIFAEVVMKNTGNPKDPHLALEQSLLRACCLYVERSRTIPENERNLYTAYSMILQGAEALDKLFETAKYDAELRVAYDAYASFKGSDNLRGNVIANLSSRLQVIPTARKMVSTDDIDLTLPGKQKCIYYCCMSDMHETMKFLATLFFSFLFLDLGDYADSQHSRRLPVPVNVILEEAANVGEIVGLGKYLATARSRAISITMIVQGIGQLRKIYGDEDTENILNDCSIHACIGTNDKSTADHFEWFSGESTVKVKTEQHEKFEGPLAHRFRHSTGDGKRHVFTSNEIRKIKRGHILIGWQGYDTIMCKTFGIDQHPEFIKGHMPTVDPHIRIPLSNDEARGFMRAKEEQRVMDYEEWEKDGGFHWEGYDFPTPKYEGPSRHKPAPHVIPYPELEQMALDHAAQLESSLEEEMLAATQEKEERETSAGEPAIELPADMEWDYIPLQPSEITPMEMLLQTEKLEPEENQEPDEPQEIEPEFPPEDIAPIAEPVVMTEEKRQPASQQKTGAKAKEPDMPPRSSPKRSGGAALYGTKIKRHASEKMKRKGEDGQ